MSQVQNWILMLSHRWNLINCSETLSRAFIHEDIWHILPVSSVDFEIWLLYECQQHVTNLTIYESLLWERTDIHVYPVLPYEPMKRFLPDDNWVVFPLSVHFFSCCRLISKRFRFDCNLNLHIKYFINMTYPLNNNKILVNNWPNICLTFFWCNAN